VLEQWKVMLPKFVRVMPVEYKKVIEQRKVQKAVSKEAAVHG
jgi:glutamate synthase domain-containing protein 3